MDATWQALVKKAQKRTGRASRKVDSVTNLYGAAATIEIDNALFDVAEALDAVPDAVHSAIGDERRRTTAAHETTRKVRAELKEARLQLNRALDEVEERAKRGRREVPEWFEEARRAASPATEITFTFNTARIEEAIKSTIASGGLLAPGWSS